MESEQEKRVVVAVGIGYAARPPCAPGPFVQFAQFFRGIGAAQVIGVAGENQFVVPVVPGGSRLAARAADETPEVLAAQGMRTRCRGRHRAGQHIPQQFSDHETPS